MRSKTLVSVLTALLIVACLLAIYKGGKKVKQKWIVYKTLHSPHWRSRKTEIEQIPVGKHKVIFLGNSLTEMFDLPYFFGDSMLLNCGIVGDFTEGLLARTDAIIRLKPEKLFIEIGINDIIEQVPSDEILANYSLLIDRITEGSPGTRIYIQNNFPLVIRRPGLFTGNEDVNERVQEQNKRLEILSRNKNATYIDLYSVFMRSGNIEELLIPDGIHLSPKAYALWKMTVEPYLIEERSR